MPLVAILIYFVGCLLVGLLGSKRTVGFWGFFILSIFLSPLIPAAFLLISGPKKAVRA